MKDNDPTIDFWRIAEPMLGEKDICKGKIMGFPCLRYRGEFLAAAEYRTGDLIVKLPADRVVKLFDQDVGEAFAPAGRRFKEWIMVSGRNTRRWKSLLKEARAFAESNSKD